MQEILKFKQLLLLEAKLLILIFYGASYIIFQKASILSIIILHFYFCCFR